MDIQSPSDLKLNSPSDRLFASGRYPKPFAFNEEVAQVFDDMVSRSVPLYCDVTRFTGDWIQHFYQPGTSIVDIGCSTGTTTHWIAQVLETPAHFFAIDNSAAMIEKAREKLKPFPAHHTLQLCCENVMNIRLPRASAVVINYTLQFLPVSDRRTLLERIYEALVPGGIVLISEKLRSPSPIVQELTTFLYERFKMEQGYSRNEIERKKEALDQVLVPFTEDEHRQHLKAVGFEHVESLMKWNNFITLLALKGRQPC
jgi:tRNA (cmo5U34)-methyltransferase